MTHPDEGRLRAMLDQELDLAEANTLRRHIDGCGPCAAAVRSAAEAGTLASALLGTLDVPAPTERVRARLAAHRDRETTPAARPARRLPFGRADLARAALLVLGFSGAVAAAVHPASPVRRWLAADAAPDAPTVATETATPTPLREVGVRLDVADAGVRIALTGARPGSAVQVTWVEGGAAAVYAPEGTGFTTSEAEGRIEARLSGDGEVRVELPRATTFAALTVDGVRFLEKAGERVDFPGPPALVEGDRARFEVR